MTKKNWSVSVGAASIGILLFTSAAFGQAGPRAGVPTGGDQRIGPEGGAIPAIPYYEDGIPGPVGRTDEDGFSALGNSPMGGGAEYSDKAPKPSSDPHNFEGSWSHREMLRDRIFRTILETRLPYNDEGKKILKRRRENEIAGKPTLTNSGKCYPTTEFALEINGAMFIVQDEKFMHASFYEFHHDWQIRLNQKHITTGPRNFAGDSIAHWDGNTLEVETTRYKEPIWLDPAGTPASENAVITRRIRKIENGKVLEMITTVDDPKYYTQPWSFARTYAWAPNSWRVREYNCEQQVGGPNGAGYGQVKEQLSP
jgi:hypothetical protein